MVYEYALEPELVASWSDLAAYRLFYDGFGFGTGRIVAEYPSRWRRLVWEASYPLRLGDIPRARLEELLRRFTEIMTRRPGAAYNRELSWLINAEEESRRLPFDAIVFRGNVDAVVDDHDSSWYRRRDIIVSRDANDLAGTVASMLRLAKRIIFVDPHFRADAARYRRPFEAFLSVAMRQRPCPVERVEVHVAAVDSMGAQIPWVAFRDDCLTRLPRHIPRDLGVTISRWYERSGGERLHNRYILTELGGVRYQIGLDDGDAGQTDEATLMDRETYELRWRQYGGTGLAVDVAFDVEHDVTVMGIKPVR